MPRSSPAGQEAAWPGQFAQVLAETLAGSRPAQQIVPWTTEQARRRIRRLGPQLTAAQRPVVRRVLTSSPAAGVVELTAIVGFGPRVRALAIRLEHQAGSGQASDVGTLLPGQWRCTAIDAA